MPKILKDITQPARKISPEFIKQKVSAKELKIEIDTKNNPISLLALRQFLLDRLISTGGRPRIAGTSQKRNKIPLQNEDWEKLESLSRYYKEKDGISVSPGQIASCLIHFHLSNIKIQVPTETKKIKPHNKELERSRTADL